MKKKRWKIAACHVMLVSCLSMAHAQWPDNLPRTRSNDVTGATTEYPIGAIRRGEAATGAEGCYFNECGDGKTIPTGDDHTPSQPSSPTRPSAPTPNTQSVGMTSICLTPRLWCRLYEPAALKVPCFCVFESYAGFGITIPER